jgi:hypothetical protein
VRIPHAALAFDAELAAVKEAARPIPSESATPSCATLLTSYRLGRVVREAKRRYFDPPNFYGNNGVGKHERWSRRFPALVAQVEIPGRFVGGLACTLL